MTDFQTPTGPLPEKWLQHWQQQAPVTLIPTWEDAKNMYEPVPRKAEIEEKNEQMLRKALHILP